ncbi:TetR/AcrR family transcriptional regulator [Yinghuangia soli]|uniref:TetR/AcrR family transcriptional regulator n=1 Tax=Yinghuangia soli TaxID=2908204 RepID=A0AA41Q4U1_9ACTN|nr:TetR/AcrR family transcriptional regulator [Yinghuangia soli]MCF2531574.1 TetR/AcrR family transcriptional regulator [Yinghuangia soli]
MAKRGPYEKGEAKRREVLLAALEIFATEGYRGTSLRKVAARCDLSLAGLMHYFASKEDMLTQVLRMRDEAANTPRTAEHSVQDHLATIRNNSSTPGLVELFVSMAAAAGDPEHPAHAFYAERYPVVREHAARLLQTAMDEGRMSTAVPADRAAVMLLSVADGVQLQWLVDRSIDMEQPIVDALALLGYRAGEAN